MNSLTNEWNEALEDFKAGFGQIKSGISETKSDLRQLREDYTKVIRDVTELRRGHIARAGQSRGSGPVSDDCARFLGALAITAGIRGGVLAEDKFGDVARQILGIEIRTALTSSDIPLPVGYSGEVVELIGQYSASRRYGTVYPLGAGTLKLPKLSTDPAFGLIAASGTVTEKSPQVGWVTFAAEKFGGLVRLPTELEEDSIVALGYFLARYSARNIAIVEDQVFWMNLDGSTYGAVKGLCGSTITNSKVVQMASTKTHYSDATLTNLRTLRGVPDAAALRTGAYYMHPSFEQLLATFNTAGDRPYNPNAQLGNTGGMPFQIVPTLDGFPIRWVDIMPAYSTGVNASKVFVLFGDPSYQYLGTRGPIRFDTSQEAGFANDEILVRALERFTIGLMATGAVGGLQTAAS